MYVYAHVENRSKRWQGTELLEMLLLLLLFRKAYKLCDDLRKNI